MPPTSLSSIKYVILSVSLGKSVSSNQLQHQKNLDWFSTIIGGSIFILWGDQTILFSLCTHISYRLAFMEIEHVTSEPFVAWNIILLRLGIKPNGKSWLDAMGMDMCNKRLLSMAIVGLFIPCAWHTGCQLWLGSRQLMRFVMMLREGFLI